MISLVTYQPGKEERWRESCLDRWLGSMGSGGQRQYISNTGARGTERSILERYGENASIWKLNKAIDGHTDIHISIHIK